MSTATSEHVFEIMIHSSPETIWKSITDGEATQKYYFHTRVESDWTAKSPINYFEEDGGLSASGEILEITPGSLLKTTYKPVWLDNGVSPSVVSWEIQQLQPSLSLVKLTHAEVDDATIAQMSSGWVYVLSNLKSVLETGEALPELFG